MLNSSMPNIAILGAGIMGSSAALLLARHGINVTLFDKEKMPVTAASRWNEGKIHLGFIYNADSSLNTARHVLPGSLLFKPLMEDLIGCAISPAVTEQDDIYLCHKDSVVSPKATWDYFQQTAQLVSQHPDANKYLTDVSSCRAYKLTTNELASITSSKDILAGFSVPEHSVDTNWIADKILNAIDREINITKQMETFVRAVYPENVLNKKSRWYVEAPDAVYGPFDYIINSLWEGKLAVDVTAGVPPGSDHSNRYRLAVFIQTEKPLNLPNVIIATGPFGDIKNYNNYNFYVSWYPKGMILESMEVVPPPTPVLDEPLETEIVEATLNKISEFVPEAGLLRECSTHQKLKGGWVFATGSGKLSDVKSTLHRRSGYGIDRNGSYFSVDTGKYASAPWLAHKLLKYILAENKL